MCLSTVCVLHMHTLTQQNSESISSQRKMESARERANMFVYVSVCMLQRVRKRKTESMNKHFVCVFFISFLLFEFDSMQQYKRNIRNARSQSNTQKKRILCSRSQIVNRPSFASPLSSFRIPNFPHSCFVHSPCDIFIVFFFFSFQI